MNIDNTFTLKDGRKLGYAEHGDLAGFPVFGLHGTPGSRVWFTEEDETLQKLNIRFVTTDRPGYGISDLYPDRKIIDYAQDIAQLADHLSIDKFSVMGVSGGGIFAATCAHELPTRVIKAGLISTTDEFEKGRPPKEMSRENRTAFNLARRLPWLLKFVFWQQKKMLDRHPDKYIAGVRKNIGHLCPSDQAVMKQEGIAETMLEHMREALRPGVEGIVSEAKLATGKWGFDVANIQVPVEVWHGTADTMAPVSAIEQLATKIPHSQTHFIQDKGHFLTEDLGLWEEILSSLKA
ncbi:MAG TPA: alpha/beta hydrolase [Microscillaceae bacterium]|nr:alpha/beta hydrolase [Microscillaceae bacterium]